MKVVLVLMAVVGIAVVVNGLKCAHNDISGCAGMNCTIAGQTMGCEHGICTCVVGSVSIGASCAMTSDCGGLNCDTHHAGPGGHGAHADPGCLNNECHCVEVKDPK